MPDPQPETEEGTNDLKLPKICRLSDRNLEDAFLVKTSNSLSPEALSELENTLETSLQKVFPSMPGKEDLERQFGLDRWYEAAVPEGRSLDRMIVRAFYQLLF